MDFTTKTKFHDTKIILPLPLQLNAEELKPYGDLQSDPDLLLFYKEVQNRHFWIDDEITWDTCSFLVKYIQLLNREHADDLTPITLHFFTPGGELAVMFTLYNIMKESKIPIHTINEGACHSAGFILYLAGSQRTMNKDAIFIAHEGSAQMGGSYRETKAAMAEYDREVSRMQEIIALETKVPLEEIKEKFSNMQDWYITSEKAEELGVLK